MLSPALVFPRIPGWLKLTRQVMVYRTYTIKGNTIYITITLRFVKPRLIVAEMTV